MVAPELFDQVHILAFNRPDYLESTLKALAPQLSAEPVAASIHAWVDGYEGSRDEELGLPNKQENVISLIRQHFPKAILHHASKNMGIARAYALAENFYLETSKAPYIVLFEDDYAPGPHYIKALKQLMAWAADRQEVAIVTAHGIVSEHTYNLMESYTDHLPLQPLVPHSLWAYAVKKSHIIERANTMRIYLDLLSGSPYRNRDNNAIRAYFCTLGLPFVSGTSQDYAKQVAMLFHGKLSITIPLRLGTYIGRLGEHCSDAIYEKLGYQNLCQQTFDQLLYSKALAEPINPKLLHWLWILNLMLISSTQAAEEAQRELGDTRLQLMALQSLRSFKVRNTARRLMSFLRLSQSP